MINCKLETDGSHHDQEKWDGIDWYRLVPWIEPIQLSVMDQY